MGRPGRLALTIKLGHKACPVKELATLYAMFTIKSRLVVSNRRPRRVFNGYIAKFLDSIGWLNEVVPIDDDVLCASARSDDIQTPVRI